MWAMGNDKKRLPFGSEMARKCCLLVYVVLFTATPKASAQFATIDASNLAQNILSFVQDGDNMITNTEQFLQNLGMLEEQLKFLKEADKRFREVRADIWKTQEVIRLAQNYEMTYKMFSNYLGRMKELDNEDIQYYQVRSAVNEGFQYLLYASREVKRARDYLDKATQMSEEERIKGLQECDKSVSKANAAMYRHILEKYDDIDRGRIVNSNMNALRDAFKINYNRL